MRACIRDVYTCLNSQDLEDQPAMKANPDQEQIRIGGADMLDFCAVYELFSKVLEACSSAQ